MKSAIATLLFIAAASGAAAAAERCDAPVNEWQPREALQAKLEKDGWTVRKIKTEDGCYEAYATNAKGERMETFFNPKTLESVGDDDEG